MSIPARLSSVRDAVEEAQRYAVLAGSDADLGERRKHGERCVAALQRASKELAAIAEATRKEWRL